MATFLHSALPDSFKTGKNRKSQFILLSVILLLSFVHIRAVWGYPTLFWGDHGLWLNQVERFARGEGLYTDFVYHFPPVSIWIMGTLGKLFGTNLDAMWTWTALVYVVIMLLYWVYTSRLLEPGLRLGAVTSGMVLSAAYANILSAPLPLGMYTPSAPLGFLILLGTVLLVLDLMRHARPLNAAAIGFLCALLILTKQDFWMPALYLVLVSSVIAGRDGRANIVAIALLLGTFGVTIVAAGAVVVDSAGWDTLVGLVGGLHDVNYSIGRGLPSWQRIIAELVTLSLVGLGLGICIVSSRGFAFHRVRRWMVVLASTACLTAAIHIVMTYIVALNPVLAAGAEYTTPTQGFQSGAAVIDVGLLSRSVRFLASEIQIRIFPLLLPVAVFVLLWSRRNHLPKGKAHQVVLILLGLVITARLRRGFEYVEWYHFLLEIPIYVLAVQLIFFGRPREIKRGLNIGLACLTAIGLFSYWDMAPGFGTRTGELVTVETPKGTIHAFENEAKDYREISAALAQLDPSGTRPLLASGYSGPYNYYFDRKNPVAITLGFTFASMPPNRIIEDFKTASPAPILLRNSLLDSMVVPDYQLDPMRWGFDKIANPVFELEHHYFDRLISGCTRGTNIPSWSYGIFSLYDCASPDWSQDRGQDWGTN
ncbi:MAG: hypothetical protein IT331_06820 [Anaerolineae bacterium]|nr:hypothetical protein [Anaerolineae bacterium]